VFERSGDDEVFKDGVREIVRFPLVCGERFAVLRTDPEMLSLRWVGEDALAGKRNYFWVLSSESGSVGSRRRHGGGEWYCECRAIRGHS
jgi:hypothetical protein